MKRESHRQIWKELYKISDTQKGMLLGKILTGIYTLEEAMTLIKTYQHASQIRGNDPDVDRKLAELQAMEERIQQIHETIINQRNK